MIKSYLKTAFRFFGKNKTFSVINILGLTLGTLCCLYIVLYVTDQYSYDKLQPYAKDVYRVGTRYFIKAEGRIINNATCVAPTVSLMKQDFPEVQQYTRVVPLLGIDKNLVTCKGTSLYEKDAVYADSTFFEFFSYKFIYGNAATALKEPYSVVLMKSTADKLFNGKDPVGQIITIQNTNNKNDYTVRAVIEDGPGNSHVRANIFITMNSGGIGGYLMHTDSWISNGYISSYIRLRPDANAKALEKKFAAFLTKYADAQLKSTGTVEEFFLQPLTSIHTTTGLQGPQLTKAVSPVFLNLLLLIAVLIQVIACINFMNLSTARASKRAKEVGIRKVIGAGRIDLVKQFLGESFLVVFISVLIALPLFLLALPYFNKLTGATIRASQLNHLNVWLMLLALIISTGFIAGSYPAFYLSAFRAIKVIKGNFTSHISAAGIRRSLVVFQFVLSLVLIICITVIFSQLNYIKTKDLGFEKKQRLIFSFYTDSSIGQMPSFIDDLRRLPGVQDVSNASHSLGTPSFYSNSFFLRGQKDADSKNASFLLTDEHFVKTNGISIISGRDFRPTDSGKVLINETYAKKLGLDPLNAAGTFLYDNQSRVEEIVGVMKDFNFSTLHEKVGSFLVWMRYSRDYNWPLLVANTNTAEYKTLLANIETVWNKDLPGVPFSYSFMDTEVAKQYESEISLSKIIHAFTFMAIFVSSMGLFGLVAFSAEQRSREIGIRKVLGASATGIVGLLSKDFLKLVVLSFIIAAPIAGWAMSKWLEDFPYRVTISWWMFALSGALCFLLAFATISLQAVKAALANPVKSLRSE